MGKLTIEQKLDLMKAVIAVLSRSDFSFSEKDIVSFYNAFVAAIEK